MKFTIRIPIAKRPKRVFKVDRSFKAKSEVTERTIAVGEAFGIGIDEEKTHQVYRDFTVEVKPGDIVLITGESGSGKSVLLRELVHSLLNTFNDSECDEDNKSDKEFFGSVVTERDLQIDPDEVLVDGVGSDINDALRCLSLAGLNDAFLFVRRFKELSDGQRYRYKIAKMLASDAGVWVLDDFTGNLDRETARIVAFCLQKTARRSGKTVIIGTTHYDLFDDLKPSVHVRKGWGEEVSAEYHPNENNKVCSITRQVKMREGYLADYKKLSYLHYRAGTPWGVKKVFVMELNGRTVGAIIYSIPRLGSAGRSKFLGYSPKPEEVNRDFLLISRVILHPKFRSIGLGSRLVRETLLLAGSKYVEAIAVMAKYNPFFAKAGMLEIPVESSFAKDCRQILEGLRKYGFDPVFCSSEAYNLRVLRSLNPQDYSRLVDYLAGGKSRLFMVFGDIYRRHKVPSAEKVKADLAEPANIDKTTKAIRSLAVKAQPKKYYIWSSNNSNLGKIKDDTYITVDASGRRQHLVQPSLDTNISVSSNQVLGL